MINLIFNADSMQVSREDYPTIESLLTSALVRQTLRLPENVTAKDENDAALTGAIPEYVETIRFDRTQGGKN